MVFHGDNQTGERRSDAPGIFLTTSKDIAAGYGKPSEFYLKLESPVEVDFNGGSRVDFAGKNDLSPSQLTEYIAGIRDDISNHYDLGDELKAALEQHGVNLMVDENIDGIVMNNINDSMEMLGGETATHFVAFSPTQINPAEADVAKSDADVIAGYVNAEI